MTPQPQPHFSRRINDLHPSPIREILSVIDRPGMVSFAGGLPAPKTFPDFSLGALPREALQYGASEGEPALREQVAKELAAIGLDCGPAQVLILSGSQQGIDLVAKLFIDRDTPVLVESPTYLAALQAFRFFGASFESFSPSAKLPAAGAARLAYVIPTFQNPTGRCYTAAERAAFAAHCDANTITVFEDDPYRDLAFDACERRPVCAHLRRSDWIYQGSFSKTLAPGLRLGFLAASESLLQPLTRLKQAADLHSNRVSQWLVLQSLRDPRRADRIAGLQQAYRAKRDAFAALLAEYWSDIATWEMPAGGLFFWLTLKQRIDTQALLPAALERDVAFMPGEPFYADAGVPRGTIRLNFSHAPQAEARRGLRDLADLFAAQVNGA